MYDLPAEERRTVIAYWLHRVEPEVRDRYPRAWPLTLDDLRRWALQVGIVRRG